ncbi:hypothetical protein N5C93_30570 [Pseudomonas nitroreducens]|uniref:hypothetical protein n=1 Tax=Pseudomonas nitroreducens TaxID=46680 RepID=UPI001474B024|nr:hypothetical protein [Pseudomonas nitroreducens]MDG9852885.1 hypothetical protein [Pseudomonas nitroreducens]MDH1077184.1 hypothetical protein [Pseudomonas nitroreducens]NMZ76709.1 hypothetical protein [Pseudomonas nitroreducens]HCL3146630.1 hypothetical protein [Pseudomonas aeruginosa]
MGSDTSRKKSQGRPPLSPLEKQRRLVARLHENLGELEREIEEESGHLFVDDDLQRHLLLSTFLQRLSFATEAAKLEHEGLKEQAKAVRQKLNLFRPQGLTEEAWNALPDAEKRLAPGKPKMPKELELARIAIERDEELEKLRSMETEAGEEQSDIDTLRERHGKNQIGRPGNDTLGMLDRQLSTAVYKRRDLVRQADKGQGQGQKSGMGRPRKSHEERYAYFTSIIDHCRAEIAEGESKLNLVHLQLRYLKRLRDRATRIRLQVRNALGPALVILKKDLVVVEDQIKVEADLLNDYQDNYILMSDSQLESRRNAVEKKIQAFDSLEFTSSHT